MSRFWQVQFQNGDRVRLYKDGAKLQRNEARHIASDTVRARFESIARVIDTRDEWKGN